MIGASQQPALVPLIALDATLNESARLPNAQFAVRFGMVARQIQVRCTTVDSFCSERGVKQIDVLKIDTEGFDFEVLIGARSMLAQQAIKFISFEFNDISPRKATAGGA